MPERTLHVGEYKYDVFLSHASEDKEDVARPLALALRQRGLRVWYDEFEFRIGDNLIAKLNTGINSSRYGILVLSKDFFGKDWTEYELNTLESLTVTEDYILFPILHNVSVNELRAHRASLANIFSRSTATHTVEEIAIEIHEVILESSMLY
ncbi:MAG: toll/interleukin-1 receptor domain-containing protein [Chloroflexi bacterium]|nr:toll/interleukin-1 receptor domain-containing protein [Chloroflexota bacterium]MCY3582149.1 toll/interleukin-1 receptor domain-containing protein [Chloroflexota bacterium]MCY3716922.1 toll/interleukin-1 receptor domain-containing protein [Chloroflexota bacterium]MDE2649491.1 toll/interleukin-1 receptor domain-containing protein [Chloroflexota bacterium]MXX84657.1 toll/interleukin-1 receptor domain-containing protein [Chloroflexota bacterium]